MTTKSINPIIAKLRQNSKDNNANIVSKSKYFLEHDMVRTSVPIVNIALSGRIDGGLTPGLTVFAGPSKMFKTGFSLLLMKSYMDAYPDSAALFFDSEFGTAKGAYFDMYGIDKERVFHDPIVNIETLKFKIVQQLEGLTRGDKLFVMVDSIGALASKKEVQDAIAEKSVADMTRAKELKSFCRVVYPYLNMLDIPLVMINHTYKELALYPRDIVSGGTGPYLAADNIYIISRKQETEETKVNGSKAKKITGYDFVITVDKSRYVKEKSKLPVTISYEEGISKYSGLLEIAVEAGIVSKNRGGIYVPSYMIDGKVEFTEEETDTKEFWDPILRSPQFQEYVTNKYLITSGNIIKDPSVEIYNEDVKDAIKNASKKAV